MFSISGEISGNMSAVKHGKGFVKLVFHRIFLKETTCLCLFWPIQTPRQTENVAENISRIYRGDTCLSAVPMLTLSPIYLSVPSTWWSSCSHTGVIYEQCV